VPNNAVLTIVGDIDANRASELAERHFGPILRGSQPPPPTGADTVRPAGAVREVLREDCPLPRFIMSCAVPPLGEEAFDVADLTSDLLISGRASRLQKRLVRELRLAQTVESLTFPLVNGASLLAIDVTATEDAEPAELEAALMNELDRLGEEAPSDEELDRVRLRRTTSLAITMQESDERADRIGMYAALLDEPERFNTERERDLAVTGEAVRDLARSALSPENRVSLWYLPLEE
jgi:predicted Zn-dependent peptidase